MNQEIVRECLLEIEPATDDALVERMWALCRGNPWNAVPLYQIIKKSIMNERIQELEKQCWSHRVGGTLVDGQLHFDTKKFAQLIVKECIDIIPRQYEEKIKKHFGVEE